MDSAETIKSYKNILISFCINKLAVPGLVVLVLYCLPTSIYLLTVFLQGFSYVINNIFIVFICVIVLIGVIIYSLQYWSSQTKPSEENLDLHDQYVAPRTSSPEYNNYRVTEVDDDYNNINNSRYEEIAPALQVAKEYNCFEGQAVMEEMSSSYRRRTRSEKKTTRMVEYQRTESERVSKTASRSKTMDGLSTEECRMTVETFITEKKKMLLSQNESVDQWLYGGVDQWGNGGFDQLQNGGVQWQNNVPQLQNDVVQWLNNVPQLQNSVVPQWENGVPRLQNSAVPQWQNGVPRLQNGAIDQWQNGVPQLQNGAVVQWQRSPKDGSGRHHRHRRSRSQRPT